MSRLAKKHLWREVAAPLSNPNPSPSPNPNPSPSPSTSTSPSPSPSTSPSPNRNPTPNQVAATLSSSLRHRKPRFGTAGSGTEEYRTEGFEAVGTPRSPRLNGLSGLMGPSGLMGISLMGNHHKDDLKDDLTEMGVMGGARWPGEQSKSTRAGAGGEAEGTGGGGGAGGMVPRRQQSAPQLHRADERYPHAAQAAERLCLSERKERARKRTPPLSPSAQPAHGLYSTSGLYSLTAVKEGPWTLC